MNRRFNPISIVVICIIGLIVMWCATLVTWDVTGKNHQVTIDKDVVWIGRPQTSPEWFGKKTMRTIVINSDGTQDTFPDLSTAFKSMDKEGKYIVVKVVQP